MKNTWGKVCTSRNKRAKNCKLTKQKARFSDNKKPNSKKIIEKNPTSKNSLNSLSTLETQWPKSILDYKGLGSIIKAKLKLKNKTKQLKIDNFKMFYLICTHLIVKDSFLMIALLKQAWTNIPTINPIFLMISPQ